MPFKKQVHNPNHNPNPNPNSKHYTLTLILTRMLFKRQIHNRLHLVKSLFCSSSGYLHQRRQIHSRSNSNLPRYCVWF